MSLSWNNVQHKCIASGSADKIVEAWDIESSHCANTLTHHKDKVQSVLSHPNEPELLLSELPEEGTNASPFVIAFGGSKGTSGAFDLAVERKNVRDRFLDQCPAEAKKVIESRVARRLRAKKRRLERQNRMEVQENGDNNNVEDNEVDDSDDDTDDDTDDASDDDDSS